MSLIDSRGQNRHSHAHRPNQSTDLSSTSSVCLCHAQWLLHTHTPSHTHIDTCVCLLWFAVRRRVAGATANAFRLLICHCWCALSATKMAATVAINCGTVRCSILRPNVPASHCLISGVHYAVFELKLSWFTNEIIRHGRFFGNENSAIREIIFPAFVLFRMPPNLVTQPHRVLSCFPARLLCYGNEKMVGGKLA